MAEKRLEEIRTERLKKREALLQSNIPPYPAEARRTHTIAEIVSQFDTLSSDHTPVILAGRVVGLRRHGGLAFIDIADQTGTFQVQIAQDQIAPEIFKNLDTIDQSDWIQVTGSLTTTKRGTKTLLAVEFHLLSKAIRPLPSQWFGLKDKEVRYRQREVDLLLNKDVRAHFEMRSKITTWLREYLAREGFLEVETPVLQPIAGGAAARPFTTHHNALDQELYLRISPELYLKRLIVGGFEKVFEIARNFRNEGVDREHNPEFTMLELYWALADYEDLMDFTEILFEKLVTAMTGSSTITWLDHPLHFKRPIPRHRFVDLVSKKVGFDILAEKNPQTYIDVFQRHNLAIPTVKTYAKCVDELYKELIRPTLIEPTILYDYPVELQPLAKPNLADPRIAEQFQLVVAGSELIKAYTELNDPVIQKERFQEQQHARRFGDDEIPSSIDEAYIRALEYGMPPTGGWGLGIDRLTIILANVPSIRDTILFPLLKPE